MADLTSRFLSTVPHGSSSGRKSVSDMTVTRVGGPGSMASVVGSCKAVSDTLCPRATGRGVHER